MEKSASPGDNPRGLQVVTSVVLLAACCLLGCKKKQSAEERLAYGLTVPGMHEEIQQQRQVFTEAVSKGEFVFVHDQAFYLNGLLRAFESGLNEEQMQRYKPVLQELRLQADVLHEIAGKKNQASLQVQLDKFCEQLDRLQADFEADQPKKK